MSKIYRLAVIQSDTGTQVVIEKSGRLLPIDRVLGTDWSSYASNKSNDLMPILSDWPKWKSVLAEKSETTESLFQSDGLFAHDVRFLPPISSPGKIICIGSNYHDHIAEMAIPMTPTYPYSFLKPANNTVRGSGDSVAVPKRSNMMDWEAELGVVIGEECSSVDAANALNVVAGYLNFNDLSARDWLDKRPPVGIDWVQHKAFDGFAPMGPYFLSSEFVDDPQSLPVRLSVNGQVRQNSSTKHMVFGVAAIIEHLTSIMTLYPGDVIATGTPAGVGHGAKPPQYLQAGDEVRMEIGNLGELVTHIVA